MNEANSCGDNFGTVILIFQLFYSFYMMTVLYTHYFIDYTSAVAFCFVGVRVAEKYACYIFDVLILGLRGEDRRQRMWKPCHKCGWSNDYAVQFID